jgi:hypothetical protein
MADICVHDNEPLGFVGTVHIKSGTNQSQSSRRNLLSNGPGYAYCYCWTAVSFVAMGTCLPAVAYKMPTDTWRLAGAWLNVAAAVLKIEINGHGNSLRWPCNTLYPQKLPLTLATSVGCSVGIVCLRTKAMEFSFLVYENTAVTVLQWPFFGTLVRRRSDEIHVISCCYTKACQVQSWHSVHELFGVRQQKKSTRARPAWVEPHGACTNHL